MQEMVSKRILSVGSENCVTDLVDKHIYYIVQVTY